MDIRSYTEHRHVPVESINECFNDITRPFFCHTGILSQYFDGLKNSNTLVYFRLVMCHIESVAYTLFIGIKKDLSFLLEIRYVLIKQRAELKTVHHDLKTIIFDYIS